MTLFRIASTLLLVLCFMLRAQAQEPSFSVYPLYDENFRLPNINIPLHLTGTLATDKISATISDQQSHICQIMNDPFIRTNFILKCTEEASVEVSFTVQRASMNYSLKLSALEIKPKAGLEIEPPVVVDTADLELRAYGKSLYRSQCLTCHVNKSRDLLFGQTQVQISNAVKRPVMAKEISTQIGPAQLQALERFFSDITQAEKLGEE